MRHMIYLERALSVFTWAVLVGFPVFFLGIFAPLLATLAWVQEHDPTAVAIVAGPSCCGLATWLVLVIPMVWIIKRVWGGRAGPWLREVAAQTGGQVMAPTLLWCFLHPRLHGAVEGLPFRIYLQRFGGVLAPATPGRSRGPFNWLLTMHVDVPARGRAGFAPARTPDFGVGFFGLRDGVDRGALRCWSGDAAGRALGEDPEVLAAAEPVVRFTQPLLVRVSPAGIAMTLRLSEGQRPEDLARLIADLGRLGRAVADRGR